MNNAKSISLIKNEDENFSIKCNFQKANMNFSGLKNARPEIKSESESRNPNEMKNYLLNEKLSSKGSSLNVNPSSKFGFEENNFKEIDEVFMKLRYKMKATSGETFKSEKIKFSRAINLIFKNNSIETSINDIKINFKNTVNLTEEKSKASNLKNPNFNGDSISEFFKKNVSSSENSEIHFNNFNPNNWKDSLITQNTNFSLNGEENKGSLNYTVNLDKRNYFIIFRIYR